MRLRSILIGLVLTTAVSCGGGGGGGTPGSGGLCAGGAGGFPTGAMPIGNVKATIDSTSVSLPVCPSFARCQCSASNFIVAGVLNTGETVSVGVYNPAAGTFSADSTTASNSIAYTRAGGIFCTDLAGAGGTITLASYASATGTMVSGTFSGTVGPCSSGASGMHTLMNGTFSCLCNE